MKYSIWRAFDTTAFNSSNDALTTNSFDITEYNKLGIGVDVGGLNTSTDVTIKLQGSYDPLSVLDASSVWFDETTATDIPTAGDMEIGPLSDLSFAKVRLVVARAAGTASLKATGIAKE